MTSACQLEPGTVIRIDHDPWLAIAVDNVKPGEQDASTKVSLKNLLTGYKAETVYPANNQLDIVTTEKSELSLSYISGDSYTFMDTTDYTMHELEAKSIPKVLPYIEEGMEDICAGVLFEGRLVSVQLPRIITRKVAYTEMPSGGQAEKLAKLNNGTDIMVPDSIMIDEYVDIDTRTGTFQCRSKR